MGFSPGREAPLRKWSYAFSAAPEGARKNSDVAIPSLVRFLNGARNLLISRSLANSGSLAVLGMTM